MDIRIIAVGKARQGPEQALIDGYCRRLPWRVTIVEISDKGMARRTGAAALVAAIPEGAVVVALDGRGKALGSAEAAALVGQWRDRGERKLCFVIGGADGLEDSVLAAARLRLSLGPQTWPHLLARAMLAEQLYRWWSILEGHPYHRA